MGELLFLGDLIQGIEAISLNSMQVRANHFPVDCKLREAVHYDVSITGVRRTRDGEQMMESAGPQAAGGVKPLPIETCRQSSAPVCPVGQPFFQWFLEAPS